MWKNPDPDPGGSSATPAKGALELSDLKDQNEQQQLLIAQLKEMLRKEQSNVTEDKVDKYINTISKVKTTPKSNKTRVKKDDSGSSDRSIANIDVAKKERMNLLKQQLEENKAKFAQRGKNQKGIEDMVSQLKAQLNDSQQLINATPLNLSFSEIKNLEYNENSTQKELYNILLTKEKRISELLSRTQRQEAAILDLEENLKEKDSVIDARTKAITLTTENLSKKCKTTVDDLDDTKEQMRKMQESFITMESDMKARQQLMMNDMKGKNIEIMELQESNQRLLNEKNEFLEIIKQSKNMDQNKLIEDFELRIKKLQENLKKTSFENEENLKKVADLEVQLKESQDSLKRLTNTGMSAGNSNNSDSEIAKLKHQLEESNKSTIKIKAQSKSKIKELNKKIDAFKKVSDANALIVQLQGENLKLSEKVAELEEEKGNMQLKMVESTYSLKEISQSETNLNKEFQNEIFKYQEDLGDKDKIISLLESDIISLKEEIKVLNEQVSGFSHLENAQVTSEIESIQIEERLDKVLGENSKLKLKMEELEKEKVELLEKIEELNKEKHDINSKLDNFIQENMELIDKLEKLSAEKVSSAESIEIVEGLTLQEKIELAAYQKNIELPMEENQSKTIEDENIPETHDDVSQIPEDSSQELLKKIEMFNSERMEVMTRMEALKEENCLLTNKIREIENNRDILAETYEQLQTEKDSLQNEYENFVKNSEEKQLDSSEKTISQNDLSEKLSQANEKIKNFEETLSNHLEEITNYKSVIEENRDELINSANVINKLQDQLAEKENDIKELNGMIEYLNNVVSNLQSEKSNFEAMESQMDEVKEALAEEIQKSELCSRKRDQDDSSIEDLNIKLDILSRKIIETEHEIEVKNVDIKNIKAELQNKESIIIKMQEKDKNCGKIVEDLKQKYLHLQSQLDKNNGSLEKKVGELSEKNKEQLEKMKKIAANLKKKTQAYQELEAKYKNEKEKWETELNEKEVSLGTLNEKFTKILEEIKNLQHNLEQKNNQLQKAHNETQELQIVIKDLEQSKMDMQNHIIELKHREEKLNEVSLKQELSTSLHEEFDKLDTDQNSASKDKIQELELIIETKEVDLAHYRERSENLEESISNLEKQKENLERKVFDLNERLSLAEKSFEEKSWMEEELGQKLARVTADDEVLSKRLEDMSNENIELNQKVKELEEINHKLKVKVKKAQEKISQLKTAQTIMEELENKNGALLKQLESLEMNQRHLQEENEALQRRNQTDYEKIENDYQNQLDELLKCKNELTMQCEKLQETLDEMQVREEELLAEITEYKQKMEQNEANNHKELQKTSNELKSTINRLEQKSRECELFRNQVEKLQQDLVVQTAKSTVEDVIIEAQEKIVAINTVACQTEEIKETTIIQTSEKQAPTMVVPTFQWPGDQGTNWFNQNQPQSTVEPSDFFQDPSSSSNVPLLENPHNQSHWSGMQSSQVHIEDKTLNSSENYTFAVENTKEELLSKIKTLEFLLYNVDKEKEEALTQCTGMVNELTRLVYERVNPGEVMAQQAQQQSTKPITDLESQIMSEGEISTIASNRKKMQRLEFDQTDASLGAQDFPVIEKIAKPKVAYLTYDPDIVDLDSQIMSDGNISAIASNRKELQHIEFEPTDLSVGLQNAPVVEKLAQPKRAYLTYNPNDEKQASVSKEAFGENDDGWGWGPEEAKLEEEHLHKAESSPHLQHVRSELAELKERIQVLEVERDNHLEEIKQLQVKSGKLIKKCKELKLKNDQLSQAQGKKKSEPSDFFDLNETIQDELRTQIAQLEKRIKELSDELEKEKKEKVGVLKRVDVLTSANERMVEMKEIQDSEVFRWKRKFQDAEEKLQQYEWNSDGFKEGPKSALDKLASSSDDDLAKIEDLQNAIKELSLDNDELQTLLDEQRQLRIDAEKAKNLPGNLKTEEEFLKATGELEIRIKELEKMFLAKENEIQTLTEHLNQISAENFELQNIIKQKEDLVIELQKGLNSLKEQNQQLDSKLNEKDKILKDLLENEKTLVVQNDLTLKLEDLQNELTKLKEIKLQQDLIINEKDEELVQLKTSIQQLNTDKEQLNSQISQITNLFEEEKQNYLRLQSETSENIATIQQQLVEEVTKNNQTQAAYNEELLNKEQLQAEIFNKTAEVQRLHQQLQSQQNQSIDSFELAQQKYQLETLLTEKEAEISVFKHSFDDLTKEKLLIEENLRETKVKLEEKQVDYDKLVSELEERLKTAAEELEKTWAVRVDQRGADIAESWKLHLETVESDYTNIQEKLKNELNELEAKYNMLVNENNELRKNVDAGIRSEVDRMTSLQQQVNDNQKYLTDITNSLQEKQNENQILIEKVFNLESEKDNLQRHMSDCENKLSSLNIIAETTQRQFDEKREVVEEIVKILEKNMSWPLSFEKQDVLNEFRRQLNSVSENQEEINKLRAINDDLVKQLELLNEKEAEIVRLNQLVATMNQKSKVVEEKELQIFDLQAQIHSLQSRLSEIQQKEEEIVRLNKVLDGFKMQSESSQQELAKYHEQVENLTLTVNEYKRKLEEFSVLQSILEERNETIANLNNQLQAVESFKNDNNQELDKLEKEISELKQSNSLLQQSLTEYQSQMFAINQDLSAKVAELENISHQLAYSQQNYEILETELNKLREVLQIKETEHAAFVESIRKNQLQDLEGHYEELISAKDLDIEKLNTQLKESIEYSHKLTETVNGVLAAKQEIEEKIKEIESKYSEQSLLIEEDGKSMEEMRVVIEEQHSKIEKLQTELFEKSKDYDSFVAQINIGSGPITQQPGPSKSTDLSTRQQEDDLSEPVSRAELDIALYMLHQRDVRCEELTVELTQLLEERDTLQLRLSNALREKEQISRKYAGTEGTSTPLNTSLSATSLSTPGTSLSTPSASFPSSSETELASDTLEFESGTRNLASKLSQLKSVGYKKDKTFVDEQVSRRMQQLSIMQQHISEASKLPPEAAAKLVDASYTLSRDVQSPSKVLLDWLWGRSVPKANDT